MRAWIAMFWVCASWLLRGHGSGRHAAVALFWVRGKAVALFRFRENAGQDSYGLGRSDGSRSLRTWSSN